MSQYEINKIAVAITEHLFSLGSEPNNPTTRIEFKGEDGDGGEKAQGGLCEEALFTEVIGVLTNR